jgi:putative ABC transport system substrate-binding protein
MLTGQAHRRKVIALLAGAAVWPFPARAAQAVPVIGFLRQGGQEPATLMNAFQQGLSESGLVEGRDVKIENRWAEGRYDLLPKLAAELVDQGVAVIAAAFLPAALAAKSATQSIPIVFLSGSDPIGAGLVSSMNRPSGNVTGIAPMFTLLGTKILELLHDLVPKAAVMGALTNPRNPNAEHQLLDLQSGARAVGKDLVVLNASKQEEIDSAFEMAAQRKIGALIVTADGFLIGRQDQIVALAARHAIPTIYPLSQYVRAGGLMSYGANLPDAYRQTGIYVGRILKGATPADLPVLQPTKVELVINLKTARALNLDVPDKLIALADEVIE